MSKSGNCGWCGEPKRYNEDARRWECETCPSEDQLNNRNQPCSQSASKAVDVKAVTSVSSPAGEPEPDLGALAVIIAADEGFRADLSRWLTAGLCDDREPIRVARVAIARRVLDLAALAKRPIGSDRGESTEAEIRADERDAILRLIEGGSFLHDDAPPARFAREVAKAIRAMPQRSAATPTGGRAGCTCGPGDPLDPEHDLCGRCADLYRAAKAHGKLEAQDTQSLASIGGRSGDWRKDPKGVTCECGEGPREIVPHTDDAGVKSWTLADRCTECLLASVDGFAPLEDIGSSGGRSEAPEV